MSMSMIMIMFVFIFIFIDIILSSIKRIILLIQDQQFNNCNWIESTEQ